ncbi:uncharacterized protein LOC34623980 [Cyclospora cayetanensis]|uniref:Uncharacterized protein LOC34623980 n=1 Tax=Cyclospora cayetanensis TaxID=88456 RepID=A0A6P6RR49_9EIME|nr:uncharacterized protein LOC34623980 [Cyclospora cayetanensis]
MTLSSVSAFPTSIPSLAAPAAAAAGPTEGSAAAPAQVATRAPAVASVLRHSSLLEMQQQLSQAAGAGALPGLDPIGFRPPGMHDGTNLVSIPTPKVLQVVGNIERSSSSHSSTSSRTSSFLPMVIESSSETWSDSEEEEEGWMEVVLQAPDSGGCTYQDYHLEPYANAEGRLEAPADDMEQRQQTPEGRVQQKRVQQHEQQRGAGYSFMQELAAALRFKVRDAHDGFADEKEPKIDPCGASVTQETAATASGIVALQMELLHLSRESRKHRRHKTAGAWTESAGSFSSTSSSSTSGTPRTGRSSSSSSCSCSSSHTRPRVMRRISSCSIPNLRCRDSTEPPLRRTASAPMGAPRPAPQWGSIDTRRVLLRRISDRRLEAAKLPFPADGGEARTTRIAAQETWSNHDGTAGRPPGPADAPCASATALSGPAIAQRELAETAEMARQRMKMRRELRAKDAAAVLEQERERQELQQNVLWWFASDILLPYL